MLKQENKKIAKKQPEFQTQVYKFRKGACTNCGSMTHDAKYCVERPRKVGAQYTGQNLKGDEHTKVKGTGYDEKRDRWNGYVSFIYFLIY